jgi:hypothetical protein
VTELVEDERLDVLAALLDHDPDASREAGAWVTARGMPADACLIESATAGEWDLAEAIRGNSMAVANTEAIATPLRLAGRSPLAGALSRELCERFLDRDPEGHVTVFGAVYWRLAMLGLCDAAKEQAAGEHHYRGSGRSGGTRCQPRYG